MSEDNMLATPSVLPPPAPRYTVINGDEKRIYRRLWWALPILSVAWLAIAAILISSLVSVQYWEVAPGSVAPVADRLTFDAQSLNQVTRYPVKTPLLFVTALGGQLSALEAAIGWIDPDVEVKTREQRFGTVTPTEQRRLGYQAMTGSKQIAEYVAFKRLGLDVSFEFGAVIVEQLVCQDLPTRLSACKQLNLGDTVIGFQGVIISTIEDLTPLTAKHNPGDVVNISVVPQGKTASVERRVQLIADQDDAKRALIGFVPADTRTVNLPFEVGINTESIGGPSAGLAFTLALLDELTPGDLTGGVKVAVTGTISQDESVGAIGALRQKTVAVKASGATVFLVPASQSEQELSEARAVAGSALRIIPVANLDEALAALSELGGSGLTNATISL